jgi:hypothetical protein
MQNVPQTENLDALISSRKLFPSAKRLQNPKDLTKTQTSTVSSTPTKWTRIAGPAFATWLKRKKSKYMAAHDFKVIVFL